MSVHSLLEGARWFLSGAAIALVFVIRRLRKDAGL
jgi:hypothetical protein